MTKLTVFHTRGNGELMKCTGGGRAAGHSGHLRTAFGDGVSSARECFVLFLFWFCFLVFFSEMERREKGYRDGGWEEERERRGRREEEEE